MPDAADERAIRELIAATYAAMSSGEPGTDRFFAHPDISIAGSGQGELVSGPEMAARMAEAVTRLGYRLVAGHRHRLGAWRLRLGADPGERSRSTVTGSKTSSRTGRRASSAAKAASGRGATGVVPSRRRNLASEPIGPLALGVPRVVHRRRWPSRRRSSSRRTAIRSRRTSSATAIDAGSGWRRPAGRRRTRSSSAARCSCRSSPRTCCSRSATSPARGSTCRRRCSPGSSSWPIRSRPVPTSGCGSRRSRRAAASTAGSTCCPRRTTARRSGGGRPTSTSGRGSGRRWPACRTEAGSGLSVGRPRSRSRPTAGPPSSDASRCRRAGCAGSSRSRRSRPSWHPRPSSTPPGTRAFFRSIPKSPSKRPVWVAPAGRGLRMFHHDPGSGAVGLAGLARLRLFERVARHATVAPGLRRRPATAAPAGSSTFPGARLTLVLSPEVWRGFSGEGRALHRLADAAPAAGVAAVRGALGWEPRLGVEALAATTGRSRDEVAGALAALALSGIVGYDLAEGGFFRRELPFDLGPHRAPPAAAPRRAAARRAGSRPDRDRRRVRARRAGSRAPAASSTAFARPRTAGPARARGTAATAAIAGRASTCSPSSSWRPMTPADDAPGGRECRRRGGGPARSWPTCRRRTAPT